MYNIIYKRVECVRVIQAFCLLIISYTNIESFTSTRPFDKDKSIVSAMFIASILRSIVRLAIAYLDTCKIELK